jgi:membrane fusion protein, heavy metal efflux system
MMKPMLTSFLPPALLSAAVAFIGCSKHSEDDGHDHEGEAPGAHAGEAPGNHEGEAVVKFTDAELKEFSIGLATAGPGQLRFTLALPGEVIFNPDQVAHILPRVSGVVREVHKMVGDAVRAGDVLAVLDSRELGTFKADYLAGIALEELAMANFQREETLRQQKISSERDYLEARQKLEEARIQKRRAERVLHAVGFDQEALQQLRRQPEADLTTYPMTSPLDGVVIERHLVRGEVVETEETEAPFVVANLSNVWVELIVYQKDLTRIKPGQSVTISFGHGIPDSKGTIDYVTPALEPGTRTATARMILANPDHAIHPGLFVTAEVEVGFTTEEIVVPRSALIEFEGKTVVFVKEDEGFHPAPVQAGESDAVHVAITAGLEGGQTYVATHPLVLKAQIQKSELGDGHAH